MSAKSSLIIGTPLGVRIRALDGKLPDIKISFSFSQKI